MSVGRVSRERVQGVLAALGDAFGSFPVNQTTISVESDAYEAARERYRSRMVDAYVQVHNGDDEVLLVEEGEAPLLPRVEVQNEDVPAGSDDPAEEGDRLAAAATQALEDAVGVTAVVTAVDRATILGVRPDDGSDRRPVYRLAVVFVAESVAGTPTAATWQDAIPATGPVE